MKELADERRTKAQDRDKGGDHNGKAYPKLDPEGIAYAFHIPRAKILRAENTGAGYAAENAQIKATVIAQELQDRNQQAGTIVMADDSGLEVDYLHKEPGIYSARYLGKDTSYTEKNNTIIERLHGVPDEKRTARFVCAIAAVMPDGTILSTNERMEGQIGYEISGQNGFGYDPIFFLPEFGKTAAELSEEEKNRISHRGKALRAIEKMIREHLV